MQIFFSQQTPTFQRIDVGFTMLQNTTVNITLPQQTLTGLHTNPTTVRIWCLLRQCLKITLHSSDQSNETFFFLLDFHFHRVKLEDDKKSIFCIPICSNSENKNLLHSPQPYRG